MNVRSLLKRARWYIWRKTASLEQARKKARQLMRLGALTRRDEIAEAFEMWAKYDGAPAGFIPPANCSPENYGKMAADYMWAFLLLARPHYYNGQALIFVTRARLAWAFQKWAEEQAATPAAFDPWRTNAPKYNGAECADYFVNLLARFDLPLDPA